MINPQTFESIISDRKLIIETGKLAGQANGAVTVRYGDTLVLATVGISPEPREGTDFLPLTIDYEERLYAAGKIPGGFFRREGRPTQDATLAARLTDRPIRPLLPKDLRNEVQIIVTVLSADMENAADILSVIGASAALTISEAPFAGPISAVRVGYIDGVLVLNPTLPQMEKSQLDLVVASTEQAVVMVEAGAKEVSEDIFIQAIKFGHEANQDIIRLQKQLQQACGKAKMETPASKINPEAMAAVAPLVDIKLAEALSQTDKSRREEMIDNLQKEVIANLEQSFGKEDIEAALEAKAKEVLRSAILLNGQRISGRGFKEIRPISCEVGVLPRTHGSALFTRGQTQVLNITTIGSMREEQRLEGLGLEDSKRFMHHYNMPPFSTGEVKRIGTPGRREIGHGALGEKALTPVVPNEEDFPYTIRLVSEVLSSSGSTSMASVCASSLSLMDAGIPIKRPVAGIAMGLITGDNGKYTVLTDIEGLEDAYGDMDFKIAGTSEGITAVQMDTKLTGVSLEILGEAVHQAREARLYILDIMSRTLSTPRPEMSPYAPRMYKLKVPTDKIGGIIGSGGRTIRGIIEETKASIDIEDDGTVIVGSADAASARRAIEIIEGLTRETAIGDIFTGKVTRIFNFGAMVEILPGKEGLVHISELADHRVNRIEDEVKVGDEVTVKVIDIDNQGRVNLSRKAMFAKLPDTGQGNKEPANAEYPFRHDDSRPRNRGMRPPQR